MCDIVRHVAGSLVEKRGLNWSGDLAEGEELVKQTSVGVGKAGEAEAVASTQDPSQPVRRPWLVHLSGRGVEKKK